MFPEGELPDAQHLVRHVHHQALHQVHLVLVVGEGLVPFQHGELGVVEPVDPLVTEVLADLVDPVQAAHDEPLQVQLVGDAQVQGALQGVVHGDERPRRGSAVERLQGGRLHLQEPLGVQECPQLGDDPRALAEDLADLRMDSQVGIPLPVARLGVRETRVHPLLARLRVRVHLPERQRPQRLGQERPGRDVDGHLPGAGAEEGALHAQPVAQVEQVQRGEGALTQGVLLEIELDAPGHVLQVGEGALAVGAPGHDTARHTHGGPVPRSVEAPRSLGLGERRQRLAGAMGEVEPVGERLDPHLLQGPELLPPVPQYLVEIFHGAAVRMPMKRPRTASGTPR